MERSMNWLATTATVAPFIGLFGTVLGIIKAFGALGMAGGASLRAVAPGIADALVATERAPQACQALGEFDRRYAARASATLRTRAAQVRTRARCG